MLILKASWKNRMLDFYSEIKSKVFRWFTEWIYKSSADLSISLFIYKIAVSSKLDKKYDDLFMIQMG